MNKLYVRFAVLTGFSLLYCLGFTQNIAINTTGAAAGANNMLEVTQSSTAANMVALYAIHSGATAAGIDGYGLQAIKTGATGNNIAGYFSASGGGNNYAIIVPSTGGNVGIGTTAPTAKLHVNAGDIGVGRIDGGDVTPYARLGLSNGWEQYLANNAFYNSATSQWNYVNTGGYGGLASMLYQISGTMQFFTASNGANPVSWNQRMTILNNGNVGIGLAGPANKLQIFGTGGATVDLAVNGRIQTGDAGGSGGIWLSNASDGFVGNNGGNVGFWTNGAGVGWNAFQIVKASGNVGIGTQAPNTTLDINGSFAFRQGTALVFANASTNNDVAIGSSSFFRITGPTTSFTITGLTGGYDGRIVTLYNTTSATMTIRNNLTSAAANQITTMTGANIVTPAGPNIVCLQYNSTAAKWLVIGGQNLEGSGWSITGNSNIVDGTNFIGTTNNVPFNIRVNNQKSGRIYTTDLMTSFGYQALASEQGYGVVAIGYQALTANTRVDNPSYYGWGNVCVGYQTMLSNTQGSWNTALGNGTLQNNISGRFNAAFGNVALLNNTVGSCNTAFGTGAARYATTGSFNVYVGDSTGQVNTTGNKNIYIGYNADATVNNLTNAIAIGSDARVSESNAMVLGNGVNVGIGTSGPIQPGDNSQFGAGGRVFNLTSPAALNTRPLFIIDNKAAAPAAGTAAGYIAWAISGYNSAWNTYIASIGTVVEGTTTANDYGGALRFMTKNDGGTNQERMRIMNSGNVGIGVTAPAYKLQVAGAVYASGIVYCNGVALCSDSRYKKDVVPLADALDKVLNLQGVNYYWKTKDFPDKMFSNDKQLGFIAQEVEKYYPELVFTDKTGYKSVDYARFTPILVEAIKTQQKLIEDLKTANDELNKSQQAEIDVLKTMVARILDQSPGIPDNQISPGNTPAADGNTQEMKKTYINDLGQTREQNGYVIPAVSTPVINSSDKTQAPSFSPPIPK